MTASVEWSARIDTAYQPLGPLPPMGLSPGTLGALRASLDARRALTAVVSSAELQVRSETVRTSGRDVPVRVYRPAGTPTGTVIYSHSGGYVLGNLDTDDRRCADLARLAGCVVVSVGYRLAPEHPYPAALDDCFDVLFAVFADPASVGTIRSPVAVAGSSAGAGLAAALALRARDELGAHVLAFQLLHQPMLDRQCATPSMREFVDTPYFDAVSARQGWAMYQGGEPGHEPGDSPGPYLAAADARSLDGLPPAYICCSEVDPLRDEAVAYAGRLLVDGVSTELHLVPGSCHGFDSVAPEAPVARSVMAREAAALATALSAVTAR